jgi:hypothetical protein
MKSFPMDFKLSSGYVLSESGFVAGGETPSDEDAVVMSSAVSPEVTIMLVFHFWVVLENFLGHGWMKLF